MIWQYTISHSHVFQAAIESGPGARDPYFFYMAGGVWHELFAKWGLGEWPEGDSKRSWEKLAASLNADRIETPLLMNSADSEFPLPIGHVGRKHSSNFLDLHWVGAVPLEIP
jgi:hypothetical protein